MTEEIAKMWADILGGDWKYVYGIEKDFDLQCLVVIGNNENLYSAQECFKYAVERMLVKHGLIPYAST